MMDTSDKTSSRKNVPQYTKLVEYSNVEQITIGVPNNYFFGHVDPDGSTNYWSAFCRKYCQ